MNSLARLLVVLVEWGIQLRRKDEQEHKQERLDQAKADPSGYMRSLGWMRNNKQAKTLHRCATGPEADDTDQ